MNTISPTSTAIQINAPDAAQQRADLVGRVVWRLVEAEAPKSGRSIFLLAGLEPQHLLGISRMCRDLSDRTLRLAISPRIDHQVLADLPALHASDDPPVSFRNSDGTAVIVIAVPNSERDAVGSSLGEVVRIDRSRLQSETHHWREEIKAGIAGEHLPQGKIAWLDAMIGGLDGSEVTTELDQFAEFIHRFISFPSGHLFAGRLRELGPVLGLPRATFDSIPHETSGSAARPEDFRRMFKEADAKYSGIPFLRGPDDKRLDGDQIRVRVQQYREILNQNPPDPDAIPETILNAVEDLVEHQSRLRRGSWEACQSTVCEALDWSQHGEKLFGVRNQKKSKSLAEKTREHFEREHPGKLEDVQGFLDDLEDITRSQTEADKEAFFEKYEDEIRTSKRLYEEWRRELFATTVSDEPDLLTAILDGIRTVLIKNFAAVQEGEDDARFFVSVKGCEKASTWENLDSRTFALFRHEAQLLSGVLKKTVEFRFGKWLNADVIKNAVSQSRKESRLIELEVGLILKDKNKESTTQKVRVFWRPSESGKNSISLAWPDDIKGLFSGFSGGAVRVNASKITPKGTSSSGHLPMSLLDTSTFSDVFGAEEGQTANPAGAMPEDHVFREMEDTLDSLVAAKQLSNNVKTELLPKISDFREAYSETIKILWKDPANAYISNSLHQQALRFGELCSCARLYLADTFETRDKLLRTICEFGIVTSNSSSTVAIIPAWHPLRLLERQEKAKYVANFIETLSEDRRVTVDGLERACRQIKQLLATWCFPEIASVNFEIYAAVEHSGGYSLAVPVSAAAGNLEALEATSRVASQHFMKVAEYPSGVPALTGLWSTC